MLAPDSRAVLLDLLRPPPGLELKHAVATTFTLDLSAALVPPLAFVARGLSASTNQVSLLTAVRSISDRIDIFCQAGQIAVPRTSSRLIDFVEPMVHAVREPRPGHLFHPKVWFVEYVAGDGTPAYRLVVQSRNLTNDASWDAVLGLDGTRSTRRHIGNRPLVRLLLSLPSRAVHRLDPRREERIAELAESLRRVEWTRPDGVRELAFHVFGVPGQPRTANFSGYRNLVVSPFLTTGGLARTSDPAGAVHVVSRPEAFDVLEPSTIAAIEGAFIVNPLADLMDNGTADEPAAVTTYDSPRTVLGGLHAKVFVAERARRAHLFLGSANATDGAFTGNVEILVELIGSTNDLGVDAMLAKDSLGPILEPYAAVGGESPDAADEARRDLDQFMRQVAAITLDAAVVDEGPNGYRVRFSGTRTVSVPAGYQVALELHTRPALASHLSDEDKIDVTFGPMPLADITPFLTVLVTTGEGIRGGAVLIANLINDPPGRFDEILARQLDTPEKFLQFLAQLLGLDGAAIFGLGSAGEAGGFGEFGISPTGIFELMVRALADKPGALDTLADLIPRLAGNSEQDSPLPDGFLQLWDAVNRARLDTEDAAR